MWRVRHEVVKGGLKFIGGERDGMKLFGLDWGENAACYLAQIITLVSSDELWRWTLFHHR